MVRKIVLLAVCMVTLAATVQSGQVKWKVKITNNTGGVVEITELALTLDNVVIGLVQGNPVLNIPNGGMGMVEVPTGFNPNQVPNDIRIKWTKDAVNQPDIDEDIVAGGAQNNLPGPMVAEVTAVPEEIQVPTVDAWALMLISALLLGVAVVAWRRRVPLS